MQIKDGRHMITEKRLSLKIRKIRGFDLRECKVNLEKVLQWKHLTLWQGRIILYL